MNYLSILFFLFFSRYQDNLHERNVVYFGVLFDLNNHYLSALSVIVQPASSKLFWDHSLLLIFEIVIKLCWIVALTYPCQKNAFSGGCLICSGAIEVAYILRNIEKHVSHCNVCYYFRNCLKRCNLLIHAVKHTPVLRFLSVGLVFQSED